MDMLSSMIEQIDICSKKILIKKVDRKSPYKDRHITSYKCENKLKEVFMIRLFKNRVPQGTSA